MNIAAIKIEDVSTPAIAPLGRPELSEIFALLDEVEGVVASQVVYAKARPAIDALTAIREHIGATLPGGYAGHCEYCQQPIGYDEIGASDHEDGGHACRDCVSKDPALFQPPAPDDDAAKLAVEGTSEHEDGASAYLAEVARLDAERPIEEGDWKPVPEADGWITWDAPSDMETKPPVDPDTSSGSATRGPRTLR